MLPSQADLNGLAVEQAGADASTQARSRRERRHRAEAMLWLTLVRDGERLASHRGGPERHMPLDGSEVAKLRFELEQLRAEIGIQRRDALGQGAG